MTTQERMMEAAKIRFRFQMNNRLRLESLAALSRVFREHGESIADELLASFVLAVPEELVGEMALAPARTNGDSTSARHASAPVGNPKGAPVQTPKGAPVGNPKGTPVPTPKGAPVGNPKGATAAALTAPVATPKGTAAELR